MLSVELIGDVAQVSEAPGRPRRGCGEGTQIPHTDQLCNSRPQWLADAHAVFDAAVSAAYGWDTDITESDALGNSVAVPYLHPLPPHRTEWMTCPDGSRGRAIEPMETDE